MCGKENQRFVNAHVNLIFFTCKGRMTLTILPGDNKRVVAVFPTVLVAVDAADPAAGQPLLPQPPLVVLQLLLRLTHLEKTGE